MICGACQTGALTPAQATFEANGVTMRKVPAQVCDNCGQAYLTDPVIAFLDRLTGNLSEGCLFCSDGRWVCERHSDQPWPHDACASPGVPCPVCSALAAEGLPEEWRGIQRTI